MTLPSDAAQRTVTERDRHKAKVLKDWSDAQITEGWRRWYDKFAAQSRAATEALIAAAAVGPGMRVLDLAGGPGDPAITLAQLVGPSGHVTCSDLSPGMVAAAQANAAAAGTSNMSFKVADMESLPFPDGRFSVVTCRLGVMFCPDKERALAETLRVLEPGARAAFVVWGPPFEQGFIAATMTVCSHYTSLPDCEVGAPTAFDFAKTGKLAAMMEEAGFQGVEEEYRAIAMPWQGTAEEYLQYVIETAVPLREVFQKLEAEGKSTELLAFEEELIAAYRAFADGGQLDFPASINVAVGRRPE